MNVEENARRKLYATVAKIDAYLRAKVDSEAMDREIDIVSPSDLPVQPAQRIEHTAGDISVGNNLGIVH